MMNERTMAGPAKFAAAVPVKTKMPAPMIAPMPRRTRLVAVRERLRLGPPSSSGMTSDMDLVRNRLTALTPEEGIPPVEVARTTVYWMMACDGGGTEGQCKGGSPFRPDRVLFDLAGCTVPCPGTLRGSLFREIPISMRRIDLILPALVL